MTVVLALVTLAGLLTMGATAANAAPPPKPPPSVCPPGAPPTYPPGGCTLVLDKGAAPRGATVTIVAGCGYQAGSRVTLSMMPSGGGKATSLGRLTADSSGCLNGQSFAIPNNAKIGTNTVSATGKDANGAAYELTTSLSVTGTAAINVGGSQVANVRPVVGSAGDTGMLLLAAGLLLVAVGTGVTARKRRPVP